MGAIKLNPYAESHRGLVGVLRQSRDMGFLGPPPVEEQIAQAVAMGNCLEHAPRSFLDLGSGGGLPGLVLALAWPTAKVVLLDAMQRRCQFLRDVVDELGMASRIVVAEGRAEELARETNLREQFEVVFARSFGKPAVTAECGAAFVEANGWLIVSEPPGEGRDWPSEHLQELSLGDPQRCGAERSVAKFQKTGLLEDRWPRRVGIPTKRPLWRAGE